MSEEAKETIGSSPRIDVEKVIANKNPKLLKRIPKFIIRYLKRIIRQNEINAFLSLHGDKTGLEFIDAGLNYLGITYEVKGIENIQNNRYIFAANHPLGGLDGMVLMNEIGKKFKDIRFLSNDFLMNVPNVKEFFIPINKVGKQSLSYAKTLDMNFASNAQMLYFPAGLCSRKVDGKIIDLEWKKTFIQKAVQHERDVIPVYFYGKNSGFFYTLAKIRAFLKIKFNIEMLYLPNEMFKQKGKNIKLIIGKPIPFHTFDKSKKPLEWAKLVKQFVYKIKDDPTIEFRNSL